MGSQLCGCPCQVIKVRRHPAVIAAFSAGITFVEYQQLFVALDLQPVLNMTFFKHQMFAAHTIQPKRNKQHPAHLQKQQAVK